MGNPPFEDVSPIENGVSIAMLVYQRVTIWNHPPIGNPSRVSNQRPQGVPGKDLRAIVQELNYTKGKEVPWVPCLLGMIFVGWRKNIGVGI